MAHKDEGGWTMFEAVLAFGSVGAIGAGLSAYYSAGKCTPDMSEAGCQRVQRRRDLGTTSMVVGVLSGLLLVTEMGARRLPAPARR